MSSKRTKKKLFINNDKFCTKADKRKAEWKTEEEENENTRTRQNINQNGIEILNKNCKKHKKK